MHPTLLASLVQVRGMPDVVVMVDPLVLLAEDVVHHRLLDVLLSIVPMHCNVIILPDSTRSPRRDCTHTFDSAVFSMAEFHHLKNHLKFRKLSKPVGLWSRFSPG